MSKSGVFGLFGSKQDLQLATIDAAQAIFVSEVVKPAFEHPEGRERLRALCDGFVDSIAGREWPEGCFFALVAAEVGARDGPIRDRVAEGHDQWVGLLTDNARRAVDAGELAGSIEPDRLALELSTMLTGADVAYLLHRDRTLLDGVRRVIRARLG
jgi:AcrR family transcriptional regulator